MTPPTDPTTTPPTPDDTNGRALVAVQIMRKDLEQRGIALLLAGGDAVALSRYLSRDFPSALAAAERAIADALPALTEADVVKLANGDHAVRGELTRWQRTFDFADVTELKGSGDDDENGETWELIAGGSSRFEVREVPRYEARRVGGVKLDGNGNPRGDMPGWIVWDNEYNQEYDCNEETWREILGLPPARDADDAPPPLTADTAPALAAGLTAQEQEETVYIVVDTDTRDASTSTGYQDARDGDRYGPFSDHDDYDPTNDEEAQAAADRGNLEDYRSNCADWPFAWNTAPKIDRMYIEDFVAAGFVVVEHTPSGDVYAGIDGGGFDFLSGLWVRAYLRRFLHGDYAPECIYLRTDDGLRRVVRA